MNPIRVLIAEDHEGMRAQIENLVRPCCDVVASVNDGASLLAVARQADADVAVLDITMPGMDGFQCLKELRAQAFQGAVVIVTALSDDVKRRQAFAEGASDYILKTNLFSSLPGILDRYIESN